MPGSDVCAAVRNLCSTWGLPAGELASAVQLPAGRVAAILGGATPSIRELAALATALGTDLGALRRGASTADPTRSYARFRTPLGYTMSAPSVSDVRLLAVAAEAGRVCGFLGKLLGAPRSPLLRARRVLPVRSAPPPWKQGYDLGMVAREQIAPGGVPLESVQELLERQGVHVAYVEFASEDIEAASLYEPGAGPVVLLNARHSRVASPLARRAILAHELCHLLHDGGDRDLLTVVSRPEEHLQIEQRAKGFAPSFIAPGSHVKLAGAEPGARVLQMAYAWGFSYEGAVWHCKNLGLVSPEEAEVLSRMHTVVSGAGDHFERPVERVDVASIGLDVELAPLVTGLLSDRVVKAVDEGHISAGRAREILSLR